MNKSAFLLCLAILLVGCGHKPGASPSGQVAATVGGQEITTSDVKAEMSSVAGPAQSGDSQSSALNTIVTRKLLAQEAEKQGLGKTPAGAMALQKARESALIELLQQKIAAGVPNPSPAEVQVYVKDNPQAFANRKALLLEQVYVPQATQELLSAMGPLTTMDQIMKLLHDRNLQSQRGAGVINLLTVNHDVGVRLAGMNVDDVFITPIGGGVQVSRIREIVEEPITGSQAETAAADILRQQRFAGQVRSQFETIQKQGNAEIRLNPAFVNATKSSKKQTAR